MSNIKAFSLASNNGLFRELKTPVGIVNPITTRYIGKPIKISLSYKALWDTGATGSVISSATAKKMNLIPTGQTKVNTASQKNVLTNTYVVDIILPNSVRFIDVLVSEGTLSGMDMLIGMDIISQGDFSISNFKGNSCFSFRVPSKEKIDFVKIEKTPAKSNKIGRNQLCPCGSGKKFKYCTCKEYHK